MSKLIRIIVIIIIAFVLASLLIFRLRINDAPAPNLPQSAIKSDVQTVEGQIGVVDTDTKTVTLVDGDKQVIFDFDDRTAFVESGHAVPPAKIQQGTAASVRYSQRGGKNWARKIELLTETPSESY